MYHNIVSKILAKILKDHDCLRMKCCPIKTIARNANEANANLFVINYLEYLGFENNMS